MLQEARIDTLDAMKAAVEFPLSFKQTLVKVLKSKGLDVDRKKTFEKPSIGSGTGKLLYGREGNASSRSYGSYGSERGIYIHLHSGNRITLEPDTMGNVIVSMNNNRKKVRIAGKNSIEFFKEVADTIKSPENKSTTSFKDFVDKMGSDLGYTFEIENRRFDDVRKTISANIGDDLPEDVKSEIKEKTKINLVLSEIFAESPIKAAYKKTTGQSAGSKGDRYTISNSFVDRRSHIFDVARVYYSIDKMKDLSLGVRNYLKGTDFVITHITHDISYRGFKLKFTIRDRSNLNSERSKASSFDIFKYVKKLKSEYSYRDALEYNKKDITEKTLPIARKIIKKVL